MSTDIELRMERWTQCDDVELVSKTLAGDREAFARIVEAYQSLVCSLAYSATGSLCQSEDLAQETFLIAWKELRQLREPAKLRSWLCSLARSVSSRAVRRQIREPAQAAEPIESAEGAPAPVPTPSEAAIHHEEEAILWRSLGGLPEIYREPLILFYREEMSVANVAAELDLSEDAVKQRLSRGRKLLADEVTALVEGVLKRTKPGKAFTMAVIAALPAFTVSASAASLGVSAGKSVAGSKTATLAGLAGSIFGPLFGLLGGWLGARISIESAESGRERQFVTKMAWIAVALAGAFGLGILGCIFAIRLWWETHPAAIAVGLICLLVGDGLVLTALIFWCNRAQQRIRAEGSQGAAPAGSLPNRTEFFAPFQLRSREYRSHWAPLGLPLIHVCMGMRHEGKLLPAKGWIAIGEIAYGALLGVGSRFALAPISFAGAAAIGVLALGGGAAAGVLSLGGGLSLGALALGGGLGVGVLASGGVAIAWTAAQGGVAIARDFAVGGAALAQNANNLAAQAAILNSSFFSSVDVITWLAELVGMTVLVEGIVVLWLVRKRKRAQSNRSS